MPKRQLKKYKRSKHKEFEVGTYEYSKNAYLKHVYGIGLEDFNRMFEEQEGKCAICGKHQMELPKKLHVDHDHKTGKVRGLLCFHCNAGIGHLVDNPSILRKAAEYLEK